MSFTEVMAELQALGTEKQRQMNAKNGVAQEQFGVKMGDLRGIARKLKVNHQLALELWAGGNFDAMMLSTLIIKVTALTAADLDQMLGQIASTQVVDWFGSYVVKAHPDKESLRLQWMDSKSEMKARMGWSLATERVSKNREDLDIDALLDRLDAEMSSAPSIVQWTMNFCLGTIGIECEAYRERVLAMGERIGAFRNYPVSEGCTSPFVPIWVNEMVRRND